MAKAKAAAGSRIGSSASGGGRPRAATEGSGSPAPPRAVNNDEEGKKGGLVGGLVSKLSFPMMKKK